MRIRKLELQGFKSFADRAVFHFGEGISGVVGPNGCGKSNVVDAVRWCIGEQSAKSLRGDQMQDVIFGGSASRAPVSVAEVSLTFVATDEPFPGIWARFAELDVTRRLYRDGGSEYLVNQEKVRLRDLQDLFLDTGVGNRLYSFIEQGRIGQIVQARPEQRRTLIEEAAGISRYKLRRDESMEKLAATGTALERVADLGEEMGRQLRSVERQVTRSLRARNLQARVRQEELAVALARFGTLVADRKALTERLRSAEAELDEASRAVARLEEDLDARRAVMEAHEAEANRVRDRLAEIEAQRRVEESAAQYHQREDQDAQARLVRLEVDQAEQRAERDRAAEEADARQAAQRDAERALHTAREGLDVATDARRAAHEAATVARERLEAQKRAATAALEVNVRARGALDGIAARRTELAARRQRWEAAKRELRPGHARDEVERRRGVSTLEDGALAQAKAHATSTLAEARAETERSVAEVRRTGDARVATVRTEAERRLGEARGRAEAARTAVRHDGDTRLAAVRAETSAAVAAVRATGEAAVAAAKAQGEGALAEARQEVAAAEAALRTAQAGAATAAGVARTADAALAELVREVERLTARVDALAEMDRQHVDAPDGVKKALAAPGALGTLADELQVPAELEGVLARALDGGLDTVLVGDRGALARIVAGAGPSRVRLLVAESDDAPSGFWAGVPASPRGRAALARLLPGAKLAATFDEALAAWTPGCVVVTRDGTVLRADGVVQLGAEAGRGVVVLQRRRELAELVARREALPVGERRAAVATARHEAEAGEKAVVAARGRHEAARGRLASAEESVRRAVASAQDHARQELGRAEDAARATVAGVEAEVRQALARCDEEGRGAVARVQEETRQAVAEAQEAARVATTAAQDQARAHVNTVDEAGRAAVRAQELVATEARHRLREAEAELARQDRDAAAHAAEATAISEAEATLVADEGRARGQVSTSEDALEVAEAAVRAEQVVLERVEPELGRAEEAVATLRLELQGHQKDTLAHGEAAASARARAERAAQRATQIEKERSDLERRRVELAAESEASQARIAALAEEQGQVHGTLEGLRERVRDERERLRVLEGQARAARERRDAAKERKIQAETRLGDVRAQVDRLREETEQRHGSSLPALLDRLDRDGQLLVEGYVPDELAASLGAEAVPTLRIGADITRLDDAEVTERMRALQELRDQLARAGEVNAEAEGEYHDIAARHRDLETQRRDLTEAMDIIEKAIAKINKTCRERFRETFDRVNEQFQLIYPRLVGGGAGRLELTDEEDLLTTGVELLVQPPGKRIQNLALLSGGEKAMAALGLIFALFRIKPSPFCLLDEVDAPLDEGNGARFNDMLREMARSSQFIVITHNKKTMECADVLYGVTMPDPGTSRLVTVKVD